MGINIFYEMIGYSMCIRLQGVIVHIWAQLTRVRESTSLLRLRDDSVGRKEIHIQVLH